MEEILQDQNDVEFSAEHNDVQIKTVFERQVTLLSIDLDNFKS